MTITKERPPRKTWKESMEEVQEKILIKKIKKTLDQAPSSVNIVTMVVHDKWEFDWLLGHDWELIATTTPQAAGTAWLTYYTMKRDRAWAQYEVDLWDYERKHGKVVA